MRKGETVNWLGRIAITLALALAPAAAAQADETC